MKILRPLIAWGMILSFYSVAPLGCGGGGTALIITPAGPVQVLKGESLQFSSNLSATTWSVDGGDANGTIDANGLYTPPATFPASAEAVVRAKDSGQEATAQVLLKTGNQIAFSTGTRSQINQTPISPEFAGVVFAFGSSNNFDVRQGSLKTATVWGILDNKGTPSDDSDDEVIGFYSQDLDFLGFSPERELFRGVLTTGATIPGDLALDQALNPYFIGVQNNLTGADSFHVVFYRSADGGATFPNPVPIDPPAGVETQAFPDLVLGSSGVYHLVFSRLIANDPDPDQSALRYARSHDGGSTWDVKDLTPLSADPADFSSALALSPDPNVLAVCWTRITDPSGTPALSINLTVSQDGGDNFSAPIGFDVSGTTGGGSPPLCDVSFGPDGKIYVTYSDGGDVGFARSDDKGASFALNKTINPDPTNLETTIVRLAVDELGRIDVVWLVDKNSDLNPDSFAHGRSTDSGASFTTVPEIPLDLPATQAAITTGLRHDASGRLFLEFFSDQNDPAGNLDLYMIRAE